VNNLLDKDLNNIINNTKKVLERAIEEGGTTIRSYTSEEGVTGRFQNSLYVHCRENEKCLICNSTILKTKVGGRGTYYCPGCQKEKEF
jgi:formamidopyrimidine-DNA glycosylase